MEIYVRQLSIIGYCHQFGIRKDQLKKTWIVQKNKWRLGIIFNAACRHLQLLREKFDDIFFSNITVLTSSCAYTSVKGLMVGAVTWKIWFTEMSVTIMRNHSWNPPSPLIEGQGHNLPKIGGTKSFARKRGKTFEKGGWCRNGGEGCHFLRLYSSVQSYLLWVCGK